GTFADSVNGGNFTTVQGNSIFFFSREREKLREEFLSWVNQNKIQVQQQLFFYPLSKPSSGDWQRLTGYITALLAGEKEHDVSYVLGSTDATDGDLFLVLGQHLRLETGQHRRLNHAWSDGVDGDTATGEFLGHHFGQRDHSRLGGRVIRL